MSGVILHLILAYGFAIALLVLLVSSEARRRWTERDCRLRVQRAELDAIRFRYVQRRRIAA